MTADAQIHVIDDDDAVRDSLAFLLRSAGFEAVTHESATAFLETSPGTRQACIITDVRMPGIDGVELLRRLAAEGTGQPVIVMTGHGDIALAVEAMKLGAFDFVEKPFDDEVILAAVRAALAQREGEEQHRARKVEIGERVAALSPRERQVLLGLLKGRANKTIAYELGISARTVEVYRANLMTKMQAASLSELIRMALLADKILPATGSDSGN